MSAAADALVLHGLGAAQPLRVTGSGADAALPAVLRAWDRCLHPAATAPVVELEPLEVLLGSDDEVAAARARGAVAGTDLAGLMHDLSPAVTLRLLEARAGQLVLLHAAALADPTTRRTAVLVAPSGTGKTTLSRTLGRRLGYVTDETAGVDVDGVLAAYPKPLSVIPRPGEPVKDQVSASELGLGVAPDRPTLAVVVFLERADDGPEEPEVVVEPTLTALASLAGQTSYLTRVPRPLHRVADLLEATGGLRRVRYRESASLEPLLAGWLA